MESLGTGMAGVTTFVMLFLFVLAIMALLMPFFVYRIRNEMIKNNKLMVELISTTKANHNKFINDLASLIKAKRKAAE